MKQCDMCFQFKDPLVPVLDSCPARVCKACAYKIGQVTGFLSYHKAVLSYQPELFEAPPTPPGDDDKGKKDAKPIK